MIARCCVLLLVFILLAPLSAGAQAPRLILELEGGPVWQTTNDVEIPNDGTATRFSLRDVIAGARGQPVASTSPGTWKKRHGLRLLLAPLSVTKDGVLEGPVNFDGASYVPGQARASYTLQFLPAPILEPLINRDRLRPRVVSEWGRCMSMDESRFA